MSAPRFNKLAFFEDLDYEPHAGQREVHLSTAPRRVLACGVRWGKSRCAAMEAITAAMQPAERSYGWVVAPTFELADKVFREVVIVAAEHLRHRIDVLKESERRLVLRNISGGLCELRAKSADNPVSLLGEGLDFVIVDEAARLKAAIWQSHISQRLIDREGWALLISTPRGKGYFYDLFRRGQGSHRDFKSWNYPSWTNPLLDRTVIDEERARVPEQVFRQEYGAEFLEGAGQVFRFVREAASGAFEDPVAGKEYMIGLDLAKVADFTVAVVLDDKKRVVFVDRFHRLDWALQVSRIQAAAKRYNHARVFVDSTGVGEPIFERLREADINAMPYPFTTASKSALVNNLSVMLEQREIILPRPELCPQLIDELESFEYSITELGHVRTGAPGGGHDDCVIALALAAWGARAYGTESIPVGPMLFYPDNTGPWHG